MAKKFALVPESWLHTKEQLATDDTVSIHEPTVANWDNVLDLLPKSYKSRGRIILHHIEGQVKLNQQNRVVYQGGKQGSHIIDLLKYFLSPFSKSKPIDASHFEKIMKQSGVPQSAIAKKANVNWKHIE